MAAKKKKRTAAPKRAAKRAPAKSKKSKLAAKPTKKSAKLAPKKAAKHAAAKKPAVKKLAAKPAAKKLAAKPAAKKAKPAAKPIRRRDGTGHLDPKYAADLRERIREAKPQDAAPFLTRTRSHDDLAEQLAEEAIETATSGENEGGDVLDQRVPEEAGGPFVITTGGVEFASGTDASNPKGSTREPFPRT